MVCSCRTWLPPLPATGVLGVPGDPQADDVAAILGPDAAGRAAEDLTAPMTWAAEDGAEQPPSLGDVVRDRMGEAVVESWSVPSPPGCIRRTPMI